jgi:uncharacterized protein
MRKTVLALVLIMIAMPVFGQQSVAEAAAQAKSKGLALAPDAPSRDQVLTLLNLLQIRKNMAAMLEGMKQAMKEGAEQGFRERIANPTPQQLQALNAMVDDIVADLPIDEMVEAMVPIYQRHLTRSDIEEVIRFYSGPVGQKLLREQPQMIQEGMQAGAQIQQKRMGQMMEKIRERTEKMAEEQEKNGTQKK